MRNCQEINCAIMALGLFQCLMRYRFLCCRSRYGLVGSVSYLYYLLYELYSPVIEALGLGVTVLAGVVGLLDWSFMLRFYLLFALYGTIITMTAFFQRIYTQNLHISWQDVLRACMMCLVENVFFRFVLDYVRFTSFFTYSKQKNNWGKIRRIKHSETH